jgi:phytanoyl-CoA hydroxylase
MSSYQSKFEGFWIDEPDALEQVETRLAADTINTDQAEHLRQFIEFGYTIFPKAIPDSLMDQFLDEIASVSKQPEKFIARRERQAYTHPTPDVVTDETFRLIDFYANSKTARDVQFNSAIRQFLNLIFERPPLAFQSLTFIHGSQQGIHQDTAYVAVDQPLKFAASWIALEDVVPGSGELIYFPGSHRFEDFLFSGEHKSWLPSRDGADKGKVYIKSLWNRIREQNLQKEHFLPKKGDVLIWAADLAHGGAKIQQSHTRKSFVTHYCPLGVKPNYYSFFKDYQEEAYAEDAYYSSRHYDLSQPEELKDPVFMGKPANDIKSSVPDKKKSWFKKIF